MPTASTSMFSSEPSWVARIGPAVGVIETSSIPLRSIDCAMMGAVFAFTNMTPGKTAFTLITHGSKRKVRTAILIGVSDLKSIASSCFSPGFISVLPGESLISIRPFSALLDVSALASLFGASCSTAGVKAMSCFVLAVVAATFVAGETTLLIALATSIFGGGAVSVPFVGAAVFGCGIVRRSRDLRIRIRILFCRSCQDRRLCLYRRRFLRLRNRGELRLCGGVGRFIYRGALIRSG